jgi:hypothetical protein
MPLISMLSQTRGAQAQVDTQGYSPYPNPDEQVWAHVKRDVAKRRVEDKDHLKRLALGAPRRIQKIPALVQSFFQSPAGTNTS